MERWIAYAFVSAVFAGLTGVIAKHGLTGISGELGMVVRTCLVVVFVACVAIFIVPRSQFAELTRFNLWWLGLSALTTTISWLCYFKAIKLGEVSTVALIDKSSFIVAVVLAWLFLGEKITFRIGLGCLLILAGLLVVSRR